MKAYINNKIQILKDMKIWKRLSEEMRNRVKNCATKFEADCLMTTIIDKYL